MLKEKRHHISPNHSVIKDYAETMTTEEWKWHLLNEDCTVFLEAIFTDLWVKILGLESRKSKKAENRYEALDI